MTSDLARAAVMMAKAHEPHQPNRRELSLWACKGIADPLTGYHCQFRGTAGEQFDHRIERVAAALLDAAPAGEEIGGDECSNEVLPGDENLPLVRGVEDPDLYADIIRDAASAGSAE